MDSQHTLSLNHIEVSRSRLEKNTQLLKSFNPQVLIAPVLKANAYGHGLELMGTYLDSHNVPFFCVNSILEANRLRAAGVKTDILIMGYVAEEALLEKEWDYIFAVFDVQQAKMLSQTQINPRVHLTIETGLHREGLDIFNLRTFLEDVKALSNLRVEGMMSHLACSNDPACPMNTQQLTLFRQAKKQVKEMGFEPKWYHLGGSLALLYELAAECNVVRCGKAFFGIALTSSYQISASNSTKDFDPRLKEFLPVMQLTSRIVQIKEIKKGDHISYSDGFIAEHDMRIGILSIGYSDGLERRLMNKGVVKIGTRFCPLLGVIAMNVNVIDLTECPDVKIGDQVIIYSSEPGDPNTIEATAKEVGTLPQDILVHLSAATPRVFIE